MIYLKLRIYQAWLIQRIFEENKAMEFEDIEPQEVDDFKF